MNPLRPLCGSVPFLLLLLAGCQSTGQVPDLGDNPDLYRDLGFVSKLPGDRAVFVAPLQDQRRQEQLPEAQGGFPITYDSDERWCRQPADMVDDVLRRELAHSRVFAAVLPSPQPGALVLMPTLQEFQSGAVELDMGCRTLAEVGIRVQVFGPADAKGERQLLHDEVYAQRETSSVAMVPMSTYLLSARALRGSMQRLLSGLDGSNVGRSNLPLALPAAAAK